MSKLFTLFIFSSILLFACQQKLVLGTDSSMDSLNHEVIFKTKSSDNFFQSKKIKLETLKPTPFIMLSAYVKSPDFKGSFHYRTMDEKGWSDWMPFQKMTEGDTPDRVVFLGNEIAEKTKQLQFKCNEKPDLPLNIRLYAPGHSKKNTSAKVRDLESACSCDQPTICGRSCWCPTGNCPIDATPFPTISTHVIVHHSAANTTSSDFAAVVRSYWDFHVNSNGWDDVGYNWLIDPNGVIYEGRGSGLQGAHFSCINGNTTGICMIGNYETATPTAEAISALENFIAWEVCDKSIDPVGMDVHAPSTTAIHNISGHLDGNNLPNSCGGTVCPGANLYPLLADIRTAVAAKPCLQDNPTSVDVLLEDESIDVFPNPNSGNFQIQFQNVAVSQMSIFNALGQLILQKNKNDFSDDNQDISIASNGMYFIKFELKDKRVIQRKVIVKDL